MDFICYISTLKFTVKIFKQFFQGSYNTFINSACILMNNKRHLNILALLCQNDQDITDLPFLILLRIDFVERRYSTFDVVVRNPIWSLNWEPLPNELNNRQWRQPHLETMKIFEGKMTLNELFSKFRLYQKIITWKYKQFRFREFLELFETYSKYSSWNIKKHFLDYFEKILENHLR